MSDEPSLPRMPAPKAAEAIFGPAHKRVRLDLRDGAGSAAQLLANSSDPAVFSSDDDPALDNYAADRRKHKKRYVGAWFAQHPASGDSTFGEDATPSAAVASGMTTVLALSPARKRPQKRTLEAADSGVWMGKGGSGNGGNGADNDEDCELPDELLEVFAESPPPVPFPPLPPPRHAAFPPPQRAPRRVFQRVPSLAVDEAEKRARAEIGRCIETGTEDVTLIGLGLTSLSNATVEPLSGLVPIPVVTPGVAFAQKDPELKIFLSNNTLSRLPAALFHLHTSLTVLSLRNNALTELPWCIGQLTALRSLNVSQNALRFLPAELRRLLVSYGQGGHLSELLVHPNPFVTPATPLVLPPAAGAGAGADAPLDGPLAPRLARLARTPVHYMDATGRSLSAFRMQPLPNHVLPTEDLAEPAHPPPPPTATLTPSRVPTLLSIALQAAHTSPQLAELPALLPAHAPPHLAPLLARAHAQRETGGIACSVCGRSPVVVPQTEWVEWWQEVPAPADGDPTTEALPFRWRGCTWGCGPAKPKSEPKKQDSRAGGGAEGQPAGSQDVGEAREEGLQP